MSQLFESVKKEVKERIRYATIDDLKDENFVEKIFSKHKIESPQLDTASTQIRIETEVVGSQNLPDYGISYTPGREMNYVSFDVPIRGNRMLFNEVFNRYRISNFNIRSGGSSLYYKIHSGDTISGNDSEIERLKQIAKEKFRLVQDSLQDLKEKVNTFNEEDLKSFIKTETAEEMERRSVLKDSKSKLNPFD